MSTNCRILKLTVKDNDFTEWIEEFAKDMAVTGIYLKHAKAGLVTLEEQREMICDLDRFRELFYNTDEFTDEVTTELVALITKNWAKFVRDKAETQHCIDYLIDNFEIKVQKSFTPRWMNGEVVVVCTGYWNKQWTF